LDCPKAAAQGWSRAQTLEHLRAQGAMLRDADERVADDYEQFISELLGEGDCAEEKKEGARAGTAGRASAIAAPIARGADGMQLTLLPPTSREEHEAAQAHAALSKQQESFREYTPQAAAREAEKQRFQQMHQPQPFSNGASSSGWVSTQFVSVAAPPPASLPPALPGYAAPAASFHAWGPLPLVSLVPRPQQLSPWEPPPPGLA